MSAYPRDSEGNLTVTVREIESVAILDFSGRITIGEAAVLLRDTIREMLDSRYRNILVNFAAVTYIDSAGLGQLVGSFATVAHRGGQLKLMNMGRRVQEVMQITHLNSIFESFADEADAVRSFG